MTPVIIALADPVAVIEAKGLLTLQTPPVVVLVNVVVASPEHTVPLPLIAAGGTPTRIFVVLVQPFFE